MGSSRRVPLPTVPAATESLTKHAAAGKATVPKATAGKLVVGKPPAIKRVARKPARDKGTAGKVAPRKVPARPDTTAKAAASIAEPAGDTGGPRRVPLPIVPAATESLTKHAAARKATVPRATAGKLVVGKPSAIKPAARKVAARRAGTATAGAGAAGKAGAATGTYVYCVVRGAERPAVASGGEALPGGAAPRVLAIGRETWLVVADVPLKAFGQDALNKRLQDVDWMSRCGVAHQAVIESFLDSDAVVPMTLFTIFANDERAIAEATKDAKRLAASLDRVAGRVEWVVRVLRGEAAATDAAAASATVAAPPRSGREFLQAKVNQRQAARRAAEETGQAVGALFTALSDVADEVSDRTDAPAAGALGSAALLDAAFLVARTAEPQFEQAARRMAQPLADRGFRVSVTGPWPCYSFVSSPSRTSR